MAERGLDVFEKYDFDVINISKGRGVIIAETDKGFRILKNYIGSGKHLMWCAEVPDKIDEGGIILTDAYVKNKEGGYITESDTGGSYIVKKWYACRNCDIRLAGDILAAVRSLAFLHRELSLTDLPDEYSGKPPEREYERKYKELMRIKKYLGTRHQKNDFEGIAAAACDSFIDEACKAWEIMKNYGYGDNEEQRLCHGSYNHHNICFVQETPLICNFEKMSYGNQILDLYCFMRKIMEKYGWDLRTGYGMIAEYDRVKTVTERDLNFLHALFSFPEKFWKIMNGYYNSNKAWMPVKNIEKLKNVIKQNTDRRTFIDTLG